MGEVAPRWAKSITQPAMEVFVGIPSVVYGWLGLTILVPFLRENFAWAGFTLGFSLAGGVARPVADDPADHHGASRMTLLIAVAG